MSRKPDTPRQDGPAGMDSIKDSPEVGRRFTGSQDVLQIEAELIADGKELPNRAIPIQVHQVSNNFTSAKGVRDRIKEELDKEDVNRNTVGYLNEVLELYE